MSSLPSLTRISATLILIYAVAGCGKSEQPAAPPAPQEVSIVTVKPAPVALMDELPGRLEASRIAEVRARVPGIVLKRTFREGSDVKAGATLFLIDPTQFRAAYNSANASVEKAEAVKIAADQKVSRYKPLVASNAISKQEYDDVTTAAKQAEADLAVAKAARAIAKLQLDYATVSAPISGRIGRAQVTEGALVGLNEATPLATIQQIDPMYVNLTQSSTEALKLQRALANGQLQSAGKGKLAVTLVTEDGKTYAQTGRLLFSDLTVDATSGMVTLRAEFPNPNHFLLPGMYVRARITQAVDQNAITIPQQAVTRTPSGASVMVVGADDKVAPRAVVTNGVDGQNWIISEGLKEGDRVIVEGLQKVQPGAAVKPVQWKKPDAAANPAAHSATAAPAPAEKSAKSAETK